MYAMTRCACRVIALVAGGWRGRRWGAVAGRLARPRRPLRDELAAGVDRRAPDGRNAPPGPAPTPTARDPRAAPADHHLRRQPACRASLIDAAGPPGRYLPPACSAHAAPTWFPRLLGPRHRGPRIAVPGSAAGFRPDPAPRITMPERLAGVRRRRRRAVRLRGPGTGPRLPDHRSGRLPAAASLPRPSAAWAAATMPPGRRAGPPSWRGWAAASTDGRRPRAMRRATALLEEQLLKLQDEERADIARDLHDEIGPAPVRGQRRRRDDAPADLRPAADEAMPRRCARSRPPSPTCSGWCATSWAACGPTRLVELGLSAAILDLVAFWRARRPDIAFEAACRWTTAGCRRRCRRRSTGSCRRASATPSATARRASSASRSGATAGGARGGGQRRRARGRRRRAASALPAWPSASTRPAGRSPPARPATAAGGWRARLPLKALSRRRGRMKILHRRRPRHRPRRPRPAAGGGRRAEIRMAAERPRGADARRAPFTPS